MGIQCREFDAGRDFDGQRRLFTLSFPETIGTIIATAKHYSWKFTTFPSATPSYQYVALDNQEVVGYYAAIPYTYLIKGKPYLCGMVCDVMTHPDWRGKGIFTKIGFNATDAMRASGLAFTTGYPIRAEVIPGHLKVGWRIVVQLPMYLRPLGLRSFLPKGLRPLARFLDPLLRLAQCWSLIAPRDYGTEILSRAEFLRRYDTNADSDYSKFFAEWCERQPNSLVKSPEFLRWRTGAPGTEYYFVLLKISRKLVGMAVVRPTVLKCVQTLAILDFMILPANLRGSRALHLGIRKLALTQRKDAVACMISSKWAKRYGFLGSAYLKSPAVFSLIIKKLDDSLPDEAIYEGDRWHLSWIDSDDL